MEPQPHEPSAGHECATTKRQYRKLMIFSTLHSPATHWSVVGHGGPHTDAVKQLPFWATTVVHVRVGSPLTHTRWTSPARSSLRSSARAGDECVLITARLPPSA